MLSQSTKQRDKDAVVETMNYHLGKFKPTITSSKVKQGRMAETYSKSVYEER